MRFTFASAPGFHYICNCKKVKLCRQYCFTKSYSVPYTVVGWEYRWVSTCSRWTVSCVHSIACIVGYSCFGKAFSGEQVKCSLEQCIHFQLFIIIYFSHNLNDLLCVSLVSVIYNTNFANKRFS